MITYKTEEEIEIMRKGGKILASVLLELKKMAGVGVALNDLDKRAREIIEAAGARPSFLGYQPAGAREPYPNSICTSVNKTIVHGLPTDYKLKNGDIVTVDAGVKYGGYHTDAALTVAIGEVKPEINKLIKITEESLRKAIKEAREGKTLGDIGAAVEEVAERGGVSVVAGLTGHGIGRELHEEPSVYNFGNRGEGMKLKKGLVIAIEPMLALGGSEIRETPEGEYETVDGLIAAHFEHTVYIGPEGPEILTG